MLGSRQVLSISSFLPPLLLCYLHPLSKGHEVGSSFEQFGRLVQREDDHVLHDQTVFFLAREERVHGRLASTPCFRAAVGLVPLAVRKTVLGNL